MTRLVLFITLPLLLLAGCREFPVEADESLEAPGEREFSADLDEPFEMALGDVVHLNGTALEVRFAIVTEDNRCPENVDCIQRGRAGVMLEVTDSNDVLTQILLFIPGLVSTPFTNNDVLQHKGQRFRLLRLDPYPVAGDPTRESEYRALIEVEPVL